MSLAEGYMWDLAANLGRNRDQKTRQPDWSSPDTASGKMSRFLSAICRRSTDYKRDEQLFIDLFDVVSTKKWKLGIPEDFLATVFDNPKARFEITFCMYRVSGR